MDRTRISITLPNDLREKLKIISKEKGFTMTGYIISILWKEVLNVGRTK